MRADRYALSCDDTGADGFNGCNESNCRVFASCCPPARSPLPPAVKPKWVVARPQRTTLRPVPGGFDMRHVRKRRDAN